MFRMKLYLVLTLALWLAFAWIALSSQFGCNTTATALRISDRPEAHNAPTVFDLMPGYAFYRGSELGKPVGEMPAESSDWAAFNDWKSNTDPAAPFAGLRRAFRESSK
jgi:hypothetical protein